MELNVLYQYSFRKGTELFEVEFFLTTEKISDQVCELGNLWLVISIEVDEILRFYLPRPFSILKQPKAIIEVIVKRETLHYLHLRSTAQTTL